MCHGCPSWLVSRGVDVPRAMIALIIVAADASESVVNTGANNGRRSRTSARSLSDQRVDRAELPFLDELLQFLQGIQRVDLAVRPGQRVDEPDQRPERLLGVVRESHNHVSNATGSPSCSKSSPARLDRRFIMRYGFTRNTTQETSAPSRAIGAVVARFVHTEEVTGSNPVSPTTVDRRRVSAESADLVAFVICAAALRLPRGGGSATRTPYAPSLRSAPVVRLSSSLTSASRVRRRSPHAQLLRSWTPSLRLAGGGWVGSFLRSAPRAGVHWPSGSSLSDDPGAVVHQDAVL